MPGVDQGAAKEPTMSRPDLHAEPDPRHDGSTTGEVPMTPVLTYTVDAGRAEPRRVGRLDPPGRDPL